MTQRCVLCLCDFCHNNGILSKIGVKPVLKKCIAVCMLVLSTNPQAGYLALDPRRRWTRVVDVERLDSNA